MNQQVDCTHTAAEEIYICLEASCYEEQPLQKQNLKLDCLRCLTKVHDHKKSLLPIDIILEQGNSNKQALLQFIQGQLNYCETLTNELAQQKKEVIEKLNQWIDSQYQKQLEQVQKYQNILNEQLQQVESAELSKDQLQTSIEYHLMNIPLYKQENQIIKETLDSNQSSFKKFFEINLKRISGHYACTQIEELPKFYQQFMNTSLIKHDRCDKESCLGIEKNSFCLNKDCLKNENLQLECPNCQVEAHHHNDMYQPHEDYFKNSEELWVYEKELIDDLNNKCDEKQNEIIKQSQALQNLVIECQINTEEKLHLFSKFIIEREQEIIDNLQKLKSKYSKDKFAIHRDLLKQTELSILADIKSKEASFLKIKTLFETQFSAEQEKNQQQFQNTWLLGQHLVQSDNILKVENNIENPVSIHIQGLNDKIDELERSNKELYETLKALNIDNYAQNAFQNLEKILHEKSREIQEQIDKLQKTNEIDKNKLATEIATIKEQLIEFNRNFRSRGGCITQ